MQRPLWTVGTGVFLRTLELLGVSSWECLAFAGHCSWVLSAGYLEEEDLKTYKTGQASQAAQVRHCPPGQGHAIHSSTLSSHPALCKMQLSQILEAREKSKSCTKCNVSVSQGFWLFLKGYLKLRRSCRPSRGDLPFKNSASKYSEKATYLKHYRTTDWGVFF